jgi:hypothetical protein
VEVMTGAVLMMLITVGTMALMVSGLTYMTRTSTDLTLSGKNALGLRWVSEYARGAMSATLSNSGKTVNFVMPVQAGTTDAYTGEKELSWPLTSDNVTRGFSVDFTAGTMTDLKSNKVIIKNISPIDPDPQSTAYNQAYTPFSFSTVGSRKVIVIQVITTEKINGVKRYIRMKNTVLLRNT